MFPPLVGSSINIPLKHIALRFEPSPNSMASYPEHSADGMPVFDWSLRDLSALFQILLPDPRVACACVSLACQRCEWTPDNV